MDQDNEMEGTANGLPEAADSDVVMPDVNGQDATAGGNNDMDDEDETDDEEENDEGGDDDTAA